MASRRGGNVFLSAGLPLMVFIVGSTYMLSQLVSGQVHVKDRRGSRSIREFQIEEEHRHMMKEFQEDYEIRRIPRPDERSFLPSLGALEDPPALPSSASGINRKPDFGPNNFFGDVGSPAVGGSGGGGGTALIFGGGSGGGTGGRPSCDPS